ncbi:prolyl 3-hydroxylase OGFOD1 [Anguilla rostrata]|uniref:prolyl 3-hydroxylase OGFOD1 n=1 Tax=Anguilla rostrata TaxID=7938 RepID=UPI0030CD4419
MSSKRKYGLDIEQRGKKKEKREETVEISEIILGADVKEKVKEAWRKKEQCTHGGIEVDCNPFPHCILRNFIQDQTFLENLQRELLDLNFHDKSNDLYKFKQSDDLKKRKKPHISGLRAVLFQKFRSWLTEVLQVELEPTVDISCAKYEYTDVLLCHDDELEGRRIAFILYLVPPWGQEDGGTLDLYSTDENFQPQKVVKSLVPSWNTLMFFEVSPVSFHQVSEVISEEKCRLSVSGWFHGHSLDRPPRYIEPAPPRNPHLPRDEALLFEWINPVYLDIDYQAQVQEEFEETSEILLKNFLKEEKFKEVNEALKQNGIRWVRRGPPNKRCYERADQQGLPPSVSACWELLSSEAFFLLLSNFTGLKLHFLAPGSAEDEEEEGKEEEEEEEGGEENEEAAGGSSRGCPAAAAADGGDQEEKEKTKKSKEPSTPVCRGEVRRWGHGDYTLVHDTDQDNTEFALDLLLHCGCEDWQTEFGGFTSYIANGEDEELLMVSPENNSLALVYRDKETLKFVKHINHRTSALTGNRPHGNTFYDFSFVYYE